MFAACSKDLEPLAVSTLSEFCQNTAHSPDTLVKYVAGYLCNQEFYYNLLLTVVMLAVSGLALLFTKFSFVLSLPFFCFYGQA